MLAATEDCARYETMELHIMTRAKGMMHTSSLPKH